MGALGNPWIFGQILNKSDTEPEFSEWADVLLRHISYHKDHYGNTKLSAVLMRKHLLWYTKGFPGSKLIREKLNVTDTLEDAEKLIRSYSVTLSKKLRRYSSEKLDPVLETQDDQTLECNQSQRLKYDPKFEMDRVLDRGIGDDCLG